MPGDEMNFGKAYVTVEARLDEYERQMLQLEQAEAQSVQRVRQAEAEAQSARASRGSDLNGMLGPGSMGQRLALSSAVLTTMKWTTRLQAALGLVRAIGSALTRLFWPVAVITEGGRLVQILRDIPGFATRAYQALIRLDVSDLLTSATVGVDKFMQKIPLVGHLWTGVAETISQVSEGLGFPNFTRDLREMAKDAESAKIRLEAMANAAQLVRDTGLTDAAESSRRRGILAGLSGADAIRAEELFNQQDLVRQGQAAASELYRAYTAQIRQLREQHDAGEIDDEQIETGMQVLTDRRIALMGDQERQLQAALAASRQATGARLAALEREQQIQHAQEGERLAFDLARARAELELDGADERAAMIRLGYQQLIVQAERDGESERAAVLGETARLRVQAVRRDERERWAAQIEEADRGARQTGRTVRDALTDLARAELELRGAPGSALRVFDINADADRTGEGIRDRIRELKQAQAEYRRGLAFGLVTDEQVETNNAYARQIDALQRLLELTEALRQKRLQLERQRGDGGVGQQISSTEALAYIAAAGASGGGGGGDSGGDGTGREQVRQQQISNDKLDRIHRAIERGGVAVLG